MQRRSTPLRVATVQLDAHLAFEKPNVQYLREPLGEPMLGEMTARLNADTPILTDLERLQQHLATAYFHGFTPRIEAILRFCARHAVDLVVFPEYTIPGQILPRLRELATETRCTIVAGTHLVTTDLLADPAYAACFAAPPPVNHAIAPVIAPAARIEYQTKLWQTQWEPLLECGGQVENFIHTLVDGQQVRFGVIICIDFLRHRDDAGAAYHREWTRDNHLLVVTSLTPDDTPQRFQASALDLYQHFHMPVVYANIARHGGSAVFGYGRANGEPLDAGTAMPPLPPGHEGVCIVEVQAENTAIKSPTSLLQGPPVRPIAYALILPPGIDPELASAGAALLAAPDAVEFKRLAAAQRPVLARASRRFREVDLVHRRWQRLATGANGLNGLEALRRLATDLWLPPDVLALADIERALVRGTHQVLRGLAARPGLADPDREACLDVLDRLERDHGAADRRPSHAVEDALVEKVVSVLASTPSDSRPATISADGSLSPWVQAAGPPPQRLTDLGFRLRPCTMFASLDLETEDLQGYRDELERAATWLALRDAPPAWVGWSPHKTLALVTATGHVVLLAPVVPPLADLRLARTCRGQLLPVALVLGDCQQWTVSLDSDVVSLEREIQRLALVEPYLRALADFEYSPARVRFVEPGIRNGPDARPQPALTALQQWFESSDPVCVVCGVPGDGRTSLVRAWLAGLARNALLRDGLPVVFIDGRSRRTHTHVSELLPDPSLPQRAALRLAVSTGNCLLVLDGFDDVSPAALLSDDHPFFAGWITSETRLLLTSCWRESPGVLLRLATAVYPETFHLVRRPWDHIKRVSQMPPRDVIAAACSRDDLDHPTAERMASLIARLERAFAGITPEFAERHPANPIALLESLAQALWTTPAMGDLPGRLSTDQFIQFCARLGDGDAIAPALEGWRQMEQGLLRIDEAAGPPASGTTWDWWRRHNALQVPTLVGESTPTRSRQSWLAFGWDALLHWMLARRIVRSLAAGDAAALELLPLHADTRAYCRDQPDWPAARVQLETLLSAAPSSPAVARNALLLAAGDPALASTAAAPWQLAGLDLRRLDLDGARLSHADLTSARLCGTSLRNAVLVHATLAGADLEACDLTDADFTDARAPGASFAGATLNGTLFTRGDLEGADLARSVADARSPTLDGTRLSGACLRAAVWVDLPQAPPAGGLDVAWARATRRPPAALDEVLTSPVAYEGALAWTPDEHLVVLGDHRGWISLWSTGPVRCIAGRPGHRGTIRAVAVAPRGATIATAGDDGALRLWRTDDLELIGEFTHPAVTGVYWEDEDVLWSFGDFPRRWRVSSGEILETLTAVPGLYEGRPIARGERVVGVPRRPAGDETPYRDRRIVVYDRITGAALHTHPSLSASVFAVSPDGARIVVQANGLAIHRLDAPESPLSRWDHRHYDRPAAVTTYAHEAWSPEGRHIALLNGSMRDNLGAVECWDADTMTEANFPELASVRAWGVLFSPSGRRLVAIGEAGPIVLDTVTGTVLEPPEPPSPAAWHAELAWTPTGLRVHTPSQVIDLDLIACRTHARHERLPRGSAYSLSSIRDAAGERVVIAIAENRYAIRDARGDVLHLHPPPPQRARPAPRGEPQASISPDGNLVMIQQAVATGTLFDVWDARTGAHDLRDLLPGFGSMLVVTEARVQPLIERLNYEWIYLVDRARRTRLALRAFEAGNVASSGRGGHLVFFTGQQLHVVNTAPLVDRLARLADGETREEALGSEATLWSASGLVNVGSCAIDEAHDLLAVAVPRRVELYRLSDGTRLQPLVTDVGVASLAISPDGAHLASHWKGEVQLWDLSLRVRIARAGIQPSGAVLLADGRFQRLRPNHGDLPTLDGLIGRSGMQTWPLAPLADLESPDLGVWLGTVLGLVKGS